MILKKEFELDAHVISDIGLNQEKNEDNCLLAYSLTPDLKIFLAVADGVGNNAVPEIVSKFVIEKLEEYHINRDSLLSARPKTQRYKEFLIKVVEEVNSQILSISERIESYSDMAATLAISTVTKNNRFVGLSVGDASIFLYRRKRLRKICGTESINKLKNSFRYVIGVSKELSFEVKEFNIERGDVYITTTDGAVRYDGFNEEAMNILKGWTDPHEICSAFVKTAIMKRVNDNITVGVITVK